MKVEIVNKKERIHGPMTKLKIEGGLCYVTAEFADMIANALSVVPKGKQWIKVDSGPFPSLAIDFGNGEAEYYKLVPTCEKFEGNRDKAWVPGAPDYSKTNPGGRYELMVVNGHFDSLLLHKYGDRLPEVGTVVAWRFVGLQDGWE